MTTTDTTLPTEPGAAKIVVELSDGRITVTHGTDGGPLFSCLAKEGDWNRIWQAIAHTGHAGTRNHVGNLY